MKNTILVTGGNVGKPVALALAQAGYRVRLTARTVKPNPQTDALGIEQVVFDYAEPDTLKAAFEGVDQYFSVTPLVENFVELTGQAVEAAKAAGVKHIVRTSTRGAAPDAITMGRWHYAAEELIKASGIAYTLLRQASFMQNYLDYAATIREANVFYSPLGKGEAALIDTRDIAAVAARVLSEEGHLNQTYTLTGSESLSEEAIAGIFSQVLGRKIMYVPVPDDQVRQGMKSQGVPDWMIGTVEELNQITRAGYVAGALPDTQRLLGRQPLTFRQFVTENAASFQPPVAEPVA